MTLFHQSKVHKVHLQVLMLETFEGERPSGKQACHNDGDKLNNHIDNLRWDTCSANNRDKITHGTIARGAAHGMARLTEDVVRMIRKSEKSDCELGRQLGVSSGTVRHARTGLTWKWVD